MLLQDNIIELNQLVYVYYHDTEICGYIDKQGSKHVIRIGHLSFDSPTAFASHVLRHLQSLTGHSNRRKVNGRDDVYVYDQQGQMHSLNSLKNY